MALVILSFRLIPIAFLRELSIVTSSNGIVITRNVFANPNKINTQNFPRNKETWKKYANSLINKCVDFVQH